MTVLYIFHILYFSSTQYQSISVIHDVIQGSESEWVDKMRVLIIIFFLCFADRASCITLHNDQLDAQIFNTFITILYIYMFRTISCSSSGGQIVLTLRRLMSYIYGAPILDVSRSHTTTQHSR